MPDNKNKVDLKKESRQLLKEISAILPKFGFLDHLPVKKSIVFGHVYSYDFLKLQDIRYQISMAKADLMNYIKYKNQKGW